MNSFEEDCSSNRKEEGYCSSKQATNRETAALLSSAVNNNDRNYDKMKALETKETTKERKKESRCCLSRHAVFCGFLQRALEFFSAAATPPPPDQNWIARQP
jgi:hypothetical protein